MEPITVSSNHRFLVTQSGQPFFWLADTAWELFHRLTLAEAEHYLEVRRKQGFNVIQAVILAEMDGLHTSNASGHLPLLGDDPSRPNEYYFRDVDAIIRLAAAKGLYVGLLPTWGDKVHGGLWGTGPLIFNPLNARAYGKFLGQRYSQDRNILWILGGDRPVDTCAAVWDAMADGIAEGLGHRPFITYHTRGGESSSRSLQQSDWLSMNMMQSGHVFLDAPNWEMIAADYDLEPHKPALDGEPNYEDHPIDPFLRRWQPEHGRFTDYDVRKQAYRSVFAGACGFTYGHHSVWQFWNLARAPINFPMPAWEEAVFRPGAAQLVHLKNLMCSRPYLSRVPAPGMLPGLPDIPPSDPACHFDPLRAAHPVATRDQVGTYAFIYFPLAGQSLQVDLGPLHREVEAHWFDPRTGLFHPAGQCSGSLLSFASPIAGPDWVLVLDSLHPLLR